MTATDIFNIAIKVNYFLFALQTKSTYLNFQQKCNPNTCNLFDCTYCQ